MVEDVDIKTKVSPFAIREGEVKTFDGKDGYVSINQIINKMNIIFGKERINIVFSLLCYSYFVLWNL